MAHAVLVLQITFLNDYRSFCLLSSEELAQMGEINSRSCLTWVSAERNILKSLGFFGGERRGKQSKSF